MSLLFDKMIACSEAIVDRFQQTGTTVEEPAAKKFPWANHVYTSDRYRRAHIDVVDARDTKKLWMMHCCIFPHVNDPSPIYGFDVICGPNKISGAFHDFSNAGDPEHFMMTWFDRRSQDMNWKKERDLPDWAKQIFSPAMVAIGAVNTDSEVDQVIQLGLDNLDYYLENVGTTQYPDQNYTLSQDRYCHYQKQNPHTPRVMTNLGLDEAMVKDFIQEVLFPELGK
jgi:hypothetical protein